MTPGHPHYKIFDVEKPFVDDEPGPSTEGAVRNVFLNGVFAYLYHAIASDPHGCLGSLLPVEDGDAARACTELEKRTVLKRESGNQEEPLIQVDWTCQTIILSGLLSEFLTDPQLMPPEC